MKRLILSLLFLAFCAATSVAQIKPATATGDAAILFSLNGFGDFGVAGPIVGTTPIGDTLVQQLAQMIGVRPVRPVYGLGMKFFLGDNLALRAGVGFNYSSESSTDAQDVETTNTTMAFGVAPAVEAHLIQAGPVSFYTGGLVSFALASTSTSRDTAETSSTQSSVGVGALLGGEFFPWENVSFGLEYQIGAVFSSTSAEAGGESVDGPSTTDFGIAGPLRMTIGMHF